MIRFMLAMAAAFCVTTVAQAQTADGETPAEENICDGQSGRAFGICNAYCEAKDCDTQDDNGNGCESLMTQWQKNTKEDMPCLAGSCMECKNDIDFKYCRSFGGVCQKNATGGLTCVDKAGQCIGKTECTTCFSDIDIKSCYAAGGACSYGTFCRTSDRIEGAPCVTFQQSK